MSSWERRPLRELALFQKGRIVQTADHPMNGFAPYLGASELAGGSESTAYAEIRGAVMASDSDVLMLWDGERSGLVGKGSYGVVSSTVARLAPRDVIDSRFLYYALDYRFGWIQGRRTGTGVPHVPKDLGRILWLDYPVDLKEQKTIAGALAVVDDVIDWTDAVVSKLELLKQGLLWDLLREESRLAERCVLRILKRPICMQTPQSAGCQRNGRYGDVPHSLPTSPLE